MPEMVAARQCGAWNDVEDETALVRAASIDRRAFAPPYDRYCDRVYWYLRTRTSTSEDTADLLQRVFLHALDRIDQYKAGKGPFAGWLFGIARNLAIDHHRQRKVAASWDLPPDALRSSQGSDPETQAVQNESLEWLAPALSGLDQSKRAADPPLHRWIELRGYCCSRGEERDSRQAAGEPNPSRTEGAGK